MIDDVKERKEAINGLKPETLSTDTVFRVHRV